MSTTTPKPFISLNQVIRSRSETHPDKPLFKLANKSLDSVVPYTIKQLETASTLLALELSTQITTRRKGDTQSKLVAAVVMPSGVDFFIFELALLKMGYAVLLLSPNNSPAVNAHLLSLTSAKYLLAHSTSYQVASDGAAHYPQGFQCDIFDMPSPDVYSSDKVEAAVQAKLEWDWPLTPDQEADLLAVLMHSSGTTGMPKLIPMTHRKVAVSTAINRVPSLCPVPLSHMYGHLCTWCALWSVVPFYLFPATELAMTSANLSKYIELAMGEAVMLIAVSYMYKLLSEDEHAVKLMAELAQCEWSGSSFPKAVGDRLTSRGVHLRGAIGSTEIGYVASTHRDYKTDTAWDYYRFSGPHHQTAIMDHAFFEHKEDDVYELIVKQTWRSLTARNRPNGDYATGDLYVQHPDIKDAWAYVGRQDDTLVLVNGEKTNPLPIENNLIASSAHIKDAVVFGENRPYLGALISLNPSSYTLSQQEIQSVIQSALNVANAESQSHSYVPLEMVVIVPKGTVVPKSDKGSIMRRKVYVAFEKEIKTAYEQFENGNSADGRNGGKPKQKIKSSDQLESWLMEIISGLLKSKKIRVGTEDDLFECGLSSLHAEIIKSRIKTTFDLKGFELSSNFVFEHPTIQQIATYLTRPQDFANDNSISEAEEAQERVKEQLALVEKYRKFEGSSPKSSESPSLSRVVLTGASGSLGANVLSFLQTRSDPSIRITCLVRASTDSEATDRVLDSLKTRRLPLFDRNDDRVDCRAADLARRDLGLSNEVFKDLENEVTMVLHLAWSVNFNKQTQSFDSLIRGAHNLIQLSLRPKTQPASFFFSSSISTVAGWKEEWGTIPERVLGPELCLPMGYARSKWVVEKLCEIAHHENGLRANVLRVGQIIGGKNGVWNETEAIPLLIKSADTIHALPDSFSNRAWLPVDDCAKIILECALTPPIMTSTSTDPSQQTVVPCFHVLQPESVEWKDVLSSLRKGGLNFDVVDGKTWVNLVREKEGELENPTRLLIGYYDKMYNQVQKAIPKADIRKTVKASPTLAISRLVDQDVILQWINVWRDTGFLS
ncbi:Non-ribosomal peptide synthetase/alpha-aminoadipate reductase and related enzymes [Phaffia rhodozyma]|uniref:Non-ribosomal peptide synthetase/alpha-aminoadipate reductase and related enzymes n=1 Tax=Phaffia rhodozyma TaxID=264483 RepID=A0A0F7SG33_PHARH|nr:Non-ribosomal peptide synthetase/alpha-aminoadipate reductase and related enzymes [Phaffia rhodozyma]